ncbi:MAG: FGGY-family carbohydrate kinase [Eubacteriales bacterium]
MYILGADIGTSGAKAVVMASDGTIIAQARQNYPILTYSGGQVEQRASDWWDAFCAITRDCLSQLSDTQRDGLAAVSLSAQGGTTVALDPDGKELGNALVWMDTRAKDIADNMSVKYGQDFFYLKNGWRNGAGMSISHIAWMLRNGIPAHGTRFSTTLEYMNLRLCGQFVTDVTCGALAGMTDFERPDWDDEILAAAGITRDNLAQMVKAGTLIGKVKGHESGLPEGLPVICGAHDQYCCAIGAGITSPGSLMVATGTAWVLLAATREAVYDRERYLIYPCRHVAGGYGAMSSIPCGGASLSWLVDNVMGGADKNPLSEVDAEASKRLGVDGELFVYPFFSGSEEDMYKKASITGLTLGHDRYDLALKIMEGITFELRYELDYFAQNGIEIPNTVTMTGGAAKSPLWRKIVASVTAREVRYPAFADLAPVGAAMIAGVEIGMWSGYSEAAVSFGAASGGYSTEKPDEGLTAFYNSKYKGYLKGRN